jgi:SAM-dependent methyltransferase
MNAFKLNITPKWDPETQTLLFETAGMLHDIHREIACFKERCVREKLIELGWTPPPPAPVLDACCGSKMFWFDRQDSRAVFVDNRRETHALPDVSSAGGVRTLEINPDIVADFTELPFPADHFAMVVFDPPHLVRAGKKGWQAKKYGKLEGDWREMIRQGFTECFRVLKPEGTLIFKWNEHEVPVSQILALTPERPLVGQRCGKTAKTHWLVFMKSPASGSNHHSWTERDRW